MEDFSRYSEVIRRAVEYLLVFIDEYPSLCEPYNKESLETSLLEYVHHFKYQRELEYSLGEKSIAEKENTDHIEDHNVEINTPIHSSNALEFEGVLSSLFSMFVKVGNREKDSAEPLRITALHTGKS